MQDPALRALLLGVASSAIHAGLSGTRPSPPRSADFPMPLRVARASFVTLHLRQRLRGCIGSLDANRPLVEDVAHNAYAAAFEDPRFSPLSRPEFAGIEIHLSILTQPEALSFSSESDLLAQLRPRVDGLVLQQGGRRGTFLPSVWELVPEPRDFLRQLKRKAGLPEDYWSTDIIVSRYSAEEI